MSLTVYVRIDPPFLIETQKIKGIYNMSYSHYHNTYEIYYLLQGERNYLVKDTTYHITKGNLVFITMNDLHKSLHSGKDNIYYERILINFKKEFLDTMLTEKELDNLLNLNSGLYITDFEENNLIEELILKMLKEQKSKLPASELYIKTLLLQLLLTLNRYSMKVITHDKTTHKNQTIFEIIQYLNANYANKISLSHLSTLFFMSQSHLSRSFKEVTELNIITYLNIIRIKESQKLLTDSNKSINEIAYKVGYESITHFERVFKSITSITPLKYRKLNKQ